MQKDYNWVQEALSQGTRDVHVVEVNLSAANIEFESWLNYEERKRAARFSCKQHRDLFVLARVLLRGTLGSFIGVNPNNLEFELGPFGKPRLVDSTIEFNLSHSKDMALVAVGTLPLGVDIEAMRKDVDFTEVAATVFSLHEQDAIACVSDNERMHSFYRIWTRKEAFIKAVGEGLAFPLDEFDVSSAQNGGLIECRVSPHDTTLWTLRSLEIVQGYAAALAVAGHVDRVWRWGFSNTAQLSLLRMMKL